MGLFLALVTVALYSLCVLNMDALRTEDLLARFSCLLSAASAIAVLGSLSSKSWDGGGCDCGCGCDGVAAYFWGRVGEDESLLGVLLVLEVERAGRGIAAAFWVGEYGLAADMDPFLGMIREERSLGG